MPKQNGWTVTAELQEAAKHKKLENLSAAADGASREAYAIDFLSKHLTIPFVVFRQGFASGESGLVEGLPTDHGIEPALADLRLERVHQKHPAQVHIEVSGTSKLVRHSDAIFIKVEKLRQQQRTGDKKFFVIVYDQYQPETGPVRRQPVLVRVPEGELDLTGDVAGRYNDRRGVHTRVIGGQQMLALPASSPWVMSAERFVEEVEQALNAAHYRHLTEQQQDADRKVHSLLQTDESRLDVLNKRYMKARVALTLRGMQIAELLEEDRILLALRGALNNDDVVAEYRSAVGSLKRQVNKR